MGKLKEEIARKLFFDFEDYEKGTIAEMCWREAPQARKDIWLKKADQILSLVCKRIEGVENPYPITRYYDPRYLDKPVHDAFEKARKSILDVIKEE